MAGTRRTRLGVIAVGAILTAGLTGCGVVSPDMTAEDYAPGDGSMIIVDDVRGLNLMIVTEAEGENGILLGAVANRGFSDQTVSIELGGDELFTGTISAESTHLLEDGEPVVVSNVPAAPGAMIDMVLTVEGAGSQTESVPVVDGTLPAYADVLEEHADALN